MPTLRSLHATRHSASTSRFEPGSLNRTRTFDPPCSGLIVLIATPPLLRFRVKRGGNRVAETVGHRDPEHDARAAAAIEVVGEQVGRQRRQDVLDRAVLVHVAGHAKRRQVADLLGARDGAAENQDRQPPLIDLPDGPNELDPAGMRQA